MKRYVKVLSILISFLLVLTVCSGGAKKGDEGKFTAGTYEIEIDGYGGPMKVETVFTDDSIEKVEVLEHNETDGIGTNAVEQIPDAIVDSQSLGVEIVSGATSSSQAILKAVEKAVVEAGGDVESLKNVKTEETAKGDPVKEETDVLVVGGGGAGLSAAIAAARGGADVVLIEKTSALGGNTIRAGGPYNAVDPERQKSVPEADQASMEKAMALTTKEAQNDRHQELMDELKEELKEYNQSEKGFLFDSPALHKLQTYDGGDYKGELEFIEKLVDGSLPTSEWMAKNGVEWTDDISTVPGGLWPRAHLPKNSAGKDYIDAGEKTAKELGVKILLDSPAEELIVEDDAVVGAKGTSKKAPMEIRSKIVILATGGFSGNKEMRI